MKLKLADDLSLPIEAITESIAYVARKGMGKTYGGTKLFELFHEAGAQCVAIDPIGKWWGLRLDADGKRPGLDVTIIGGERGDLPLEGGHGASFAGALIAQVVVERGLSCVIDLSGYQPGEVKAFATAFANELFHLKKRRPSVLHLFIEEASTFVPQDKEDGRDPPMLASFKAIVRKGRNYGIGVTLIDQRPQDVNKKVLNQTEILLTGQLTGAHELNAIDNWIRDKKIDKGDILEDITRLSKGEAYLWSPSLLQTFEKIKVAAKRTYDASETPKLGERRTERKLAPKDVAELRQAMKTMVERAEAADPTKLRQRIAELEQKLKAAPKSEAPKIVEVPTLDAAIVTRIEKAISHLSAIADGVTRQSNELLQALRNAQERLRKQPTNGAQPAIASAPPPPIREARPARWGTVEGAEELGHGVRRLLVALGHEARDVGLTRAQLAVLSGMSRKSSTFANYLAGANVGGWIEKRGDRVFLSEKGARYLEKAGAYRPLFSDGPARRGLYAQTKALSGKPAHMLEVLTAGPRDRAALAEASGLSVTSSTFANYLAKLNVAGLITKDPDGLIALAPELR